MTVKMNKALKVLKDNDLLLLQSLYLNRTFDVNQVMDTIYHLNSEQGKRKKAILSRLKDQDVIEEIEYKPDKFGLFLTAFGVKVVKETKEIPHEIFDDDAKVVKRGYYRASELKMRENLMSHQITKNQFIINFINYINSPGFLKEFSKITNAPFHFQYFDEKYLTSYVYMRPDGVLHIGNIDFFIEEDMSSESSKQLMEKWDHYRRFTNTPEFTLKENRIVILFLTDNMTREKAILKRQSLVRHTLDVNGFRLFNNNLDMYIGTQEEILQNMLFFVKLAYSYNDKNRLVAFKKLSEDGFNVSVVSEKTKKILNNEDYQFYITKTDKNNLLLKEDFRNQEFFIDDYTHRSVSTLFRIKNQDRNRMLFKDKFHRLLQYIVVMPEDEDKKKQVINDLKITNFDPSNSNIFFTTYSRLSKYPLYQALYMYDNKWNKHHYKNNELITFDYSPLPDVK